MQALATAAQVRLFLLGGLRVERPNAAPVTRFQTQKTAALLAYLALFSKRAHGREFLTELFWPDAALDDGRRSFRTALASLRRQLEPPGTPMGTVLIADRATVKLNVSQVEIDVARFDACCAEEPDAIPTREEARTDSALAWYGGPLLPGFYEDWIESDRERLADLYRNLLLHKSSLAEGQGNFVVALDCARRAANLEQTGEAPGTEAFCRSAHIAVIRLLAQMGRPEDAQRHYHIFAERLRVLYDESPSPEARDALDFAPQPEKNAPVEPHENKVCAAALTSSLIPGPMMRLPRPLTRFFGRRPELDQLSGAFADRNSRLITLTGPGGSGKTRLSVEWARGWNNAFPERTVCFVPVAGLAQAGYLWLAIAQMLSLELLPDPGGVRNQVCQAINSLTTSETTNDLPLLILDNFEAWVDEGAPLVESLLRACPRLHVLVTPRRRLQIGGEREITVAPLPVPTLSGTPERLLEWASVQLFVDRAQAARPDFQMTPRNAEKIAALCQRLEGIPLALELTAAWAGAMSTAQMLERLETHLLDETGPPLAHQRAQRPERHRTLRAAVDTSFSLLPPDLQTAFTQLSVFRGGWTLQAAENVLSAPSRAADILSRLRERSLVIAETSADDDSLRFRLLEVLREFADENLESDVRQSIHQSHASYFLCFVEAAATQMSGAEARSNLDAIEEEKDNIRAALRFLLTEAPKRNGSAPTEEALRLAGGMARFWTVRGYWDEGSDWLDCALSLPVDVVATPSVRSYVLLGKGQIAYQRNDLAAARAAYSEAMALSQATGDESWIGALLIGLAGIAFHADNDYESAGALYRECLTLQRKRGNPAGVAVALSGLGKLAEEQGDYPSACLYQKECLERERELGNRENEANALYSLGNIAIHEERLDEAQTCYQESLQIQCDLGNRQRIGYSWAGLGHVATDRGDYAAAHLCYEEALQIARQLGETWAIAILLNNLGKVAFHENDFPHAQSLCSESLRMRAATGDRTGATRVLEALALIAGAQPGTQKKAATLWGAAQGLRELLQVPFAENLRIEYEASIAATRTTLGEKAFDAAKASGAALSFDEIVCLALK